jgi:RNA methyltransferase, TrmH family
VSRGPRCPTTSTRRPERPPDLARRNRSGDDAGRNGPRRSRTIGSQPHQVLTERSTRVVAAVKLHRHVARRRSGLFLVEGANLVEAASRRGLIREIFATEAAALRYADLLATPDASVHLVTERAAKALSDTVTPAGLLAVCESPSLSLQDILLSAPRLVAVGVEIGEPGNAGTLIRIADAMGADAVVFAGHSVDPYNGKCLRASAGSIFSVPVVVAPEADAAITALTAAGLRVLATTVDGELRLDDADLTAPTAWLFGAEAHGLSAQLAERADKRVTIPMSGSAQSLNVAAAAAICLYQSARAQRAGSVG